MFLTSLPGSHWYVTGHDTVNSFRLRPSGLNTWLNPVKAFIQAFNVLAGVWKPTFLLGTQKLARLGGGGVLKGAEIPGVRQAWDGGDRRGELCWSRRQTLIGGRVSRYADSLPWWVCRTVMGSQEAFIEVQAGGSLKGSLVAGSTVSVPGRDS